MLDICITNRQKDFFDKSRSESIKKTFKVFLCRYLEKYIYLLNNIYRRYGQKYAYEP